MKKIHSMKKFLVLSKMKKSGAGVYMAPALVLKKLTQNDLNRFDNEKNYENVMYLKQRK